MTSKMSEVEWMDIFARNLAEIMEEQGYTQEDLARATGLTQVAISNYLNKRRIPNLKAIINLSYELGIDYNNLIDFGSRIK